MPHISQIMQYDLVSHSQGFGGVYGDMTADLRDEAVGRVRAAEIGVIQRHPSIPKIMRASPRSNLEAYYVAAFWLATGALQSGQADLTSLAVSSLETGESYYNSWSSWLSLGTYTGGGEETDKILAILNSAANSAMQLGAAPASGELKAIILDEVAEPTTEPDLPAKIRSKFLDLVLPDVPKWLMWVIPVSLVVLVSLVVVPRLMRGRRAGGS